MNEKARQIGCIKSNFVNAHGFHDNNHYSTAYDMTLIFNYCLKNEIFCNIISTKNYLIPKTNKSEERNLKNTNKMLFKENNLYCEYMIGGKTGYTDEAMGTFISISKLDDISLIACVFGAHQGTGLNEYRFTDTKELLEYGFKNFNKKRIISKNKISFDMNIPQKFKKYTIGINDDIYMLVKNDSNIISYEVDIFNTSFKTSNPNIGDFVGKITFKIYNNEGLKLTKCVDLICIDSHFYINLHYVFILTISIFLVILLIFMLYLKHMINITYGKRKKKKSQNNCKS